MRQLSTLELKRIEFLTSKQVEVALIEPTRTGLDKSIMDATAPVRDFMKRNGVHDFEVQQQGPDHKHLIETNILTNTSSLRTRTSLYRPVTKTGDPRLWIYKIKEYCSPNDILALTFYDGELWVFNLSTLDIISLAAGTGAFAKFITDYAATENEVADELLNKIRVIAAKGFIPSPYSGDTSIGRLLEEELGIRINSDKAPDYKGIELKSARSERNNRKNLFAQVPDWSISKLKSSREILERYGYEQDGARRLYCTVKSTGYNPQTLRLKMDFEGGVLHEYSSRDGDVVKWNMETLETRLASKHKETFWVQAQSKFIDGVEYFKFISIEHTRDPIITQLAVLIDQGDVSLDHLIKERGNSVVEKGPIFKLAQGSLPLLFPPSTVYEL